jgi:endonuclease/exonuclease/phosphatase family metal-dependent hydrolase
LTRNSLGLWILLIFGCAVAFPAAVSAQSLRVVTYNIAADTGGNTAPLPGLYEVLKGIGQQSIQGIVQPLDILALQETTSNSATVAPIVTDLNNYYNSVYTGPSVYKPAYAMSTVQAGQLGGPANGNGPNALVYNTNTLQLVASGGVGTYTGANNGTYRQVMRYEFKPKNSSIAENFYVYVTHAKATTSSRPLIENETFRNNEMTMIRNDANALAVAHPNPKILYVGDFNFLGSELITDGTTSVSGYQTITAVNPPSLPAQTAGIDPLNTNPQNNTLDWERNSAHHAIMTVRSDDLSARFDFQFMTAPVYSGADPLGLKYVPQSYHVFGNNGTTGYLKSVADPGNTALDNLVSTNNSAPIPKSTVFNSLTTASDHLPVVADYFALLRGDFNLDGDLNGNDVATLLKALTDLETYKITKGLSNADVLAIGDINRDGAVHNSDIQPLLNLIATGSILLAVPEPASLVLIALAAPLAILAIRRRTQKRALN